MIATKYDYKALRAASRAQKSPPGSSVGGHSQEVRKNGGECTNSDVDEGELRAECRQEVATG